MKLKAASGPATTGQTWALLINVQQPFETHFVRGGHMRGGQSPSELYSLALQNSKQCDMLLAQPPPLIHSDQASRW